MKMMTWMLALFVVAAMAQTDLGLPNPQRTTIPASGGPLIQLETFRAFVNISMTATELEVGGKVYCCRSGQLHATCWPSAFQDLRC